MKQDAHTLEDANKRSLEQRLEKLTKAAQMSMARNMLHQERIQFLLRINKEGKSRRSTKVIVLGKGIGKVMCFEDLEAARTKRSEVEANETAKKNTRRRKRKGGAQRVDEQVSDVETARSNEVLALASISEKVTWPQPGEFFTASCPRIAPTARLW